MTNSKLMILQPLSPGPTQGGSLDVADGAYGPLRQFLTEYLVAWAFASQGDEAVLYGGRNPMFDIAAHPEYTDVKSLVEMSPSEQAAWPGYRWKLNTGKSGEVVQYPVEQTNKHGVTRRKTHMALVRLDPDTRFGISVTGSGLQITAEFRWARIPTRRPGSSTNGSTMNPPSTPTLRRRSSMRITTRRSGLSGRAAATGLRIGIAVADRSSESIAFVVELAVALTISADDFGHLCRRLRKATVGR